MGLDLLVLAGLEAIFLGDGAASTFAVAVGFFFLGVELGVLNLAFAGAGFFTFAAAGAVALVDAGIRVVVGLDFFAGGILRSPR